jgi:hypothetical protein
MTESIARFRVLFEMPDDGHDEAAEVQSTGAREELLIGERASSTWASRRPPGLSRETSTATFRCRSMKLRSAAGETRSSLISHSVERAAAERELIGIVVDRERRRNAEARGETTEPARADGVKRADGEARRSPPRSRSGARASRAPPCS